VLELNEVEIRVLGCLIEKQRTTPDVYPLTLNALRLACNQSTNRDPVVDYDEAAIRAALERLSRRRLTRLTSGHSSRATKYRHMLDETLSLDVPQQAVLAVLMLRGPQTPGELRQRTERLHRFADGAALDAVLDQLAERDLVEQMQRRPGQKEQRFRHLLAGDGEPEDIAPPTESVSTVPAPRPPPSVDGERLDKLEREVAELRAELHDLRTQLGG
jgi:uncharacterized protein YceH (UPF0502 family)